MNFFNMLKNIFFFLLFLQVLPLLLENISKQYTKFISPKTHVAVITIKGVIDNSQTYTKHLHTYFKDPAIKAILLKIECPGGAAGSSQALFNEILALKKDNPKPVIALVENVCASGGYYVACAADYIVAPGASLIGSIGMCLPHCFQLREFIEQYKINYMPLKAGEYKTIGDLFVDMTNAEKDLLQGVLNDTYQQFVLDVAHTRKLSHTNTASWAEGKIFTGRQALEKGLIDELGSTHAAVKAIKEKALIEGDIQWIKPAEQKSFMNLFSHDQNDHEDSPLFSKLTNSVCATLEKRYVQQTMKM